MDDRDELGLSGPWRLGPDFTASRVVSGIICSNGPCWSPHVRTFYFADIFSQVMWAYDHDLELGTVTNRREFASTARDLGFCDGSTVDAERCGGTRW
jgi:sugar lactone lactonase YvrE